MNDIHHKLANGNTLSHESYIYDAGGNLSSKTVGATTTSYTYNLLDEPLSESRTGYTCSYTYDFNFNRKTKSATGGLSEAYVYDSPDRLWKVTNASGAALKTYGHVNGRCNSVLNSSGQTTTLTYDDEDRVTNITGPGGLNQSNEYNGLDTRVSKTSGSTTKTYKRAGAHVTAPLLADGTNTFNPGISMKPGAGSTLVSHGDRLGTNKLHTNTSQTTA